MPRWVLGKAMTSRMGVGVGEDGYEAINAGGYATVGRSAVVEGFKQMAEAILDVGVSVTEELEDFLL